MIKKFTILFVVMPFISVNVSFVSKSIRRRPSASGRISTVADSFANLLSGRIRSRDAPTSPGINAPGKRVERTREIE